MQLRLQLLPNPDAWEVTPSGSLESKIPRVQISKRHCGGAYESFVGFVNGMPLLGT